MSSVVSLTARSEDEGAGWTVSVTLTVPADDYGVWLPLVPVYEALQEHLREPCLILSSGQAEQRGEQLGVWRQEPADIFSAIHGVSGLGSPLETACESGRLLVVSEDPKLYSPRFGMERDAISIQIIRKHECGSSGGDKWRAMVCDGRMQLEPMGPGCDLSEEQLSRCGFVLALTIAGNTDQAQHVATAIAERLHQAYNV